MKNWKRQEQKTCQPKSAKLKKLLVQTQKFFTENILKKITSIFAKTQRKPTPTCVTSVGLFGFNQKPRFYSQTDSKQLSCYSQKQL